jgi:predicted RNA binding protein YcfA (HicA-like mRNA interferase family)
MTTPSNPILGRIEAEPQAESFQALGHSAKRLWNVLLGHEYMSIDKVRAAGEAAGLRPGQVDGALKTLRDTGWAKWARVGSSNKLKWKRRTERLTIPQEPSRRRRTTAAMTASACTTPAPAPEATMSELLDNMAIQLGYVEAGLKQAKADIAALRARLKLFR